MVVRTTGQRRSGAKVTLRTGSDAAQWPHSFYVLVSLSEQPAIGVYRIRDGEVIPVGLR